MQPHVIRSTLLLEMGFMKPRAGRPVHGVELFRINLIRDLLDRGIRITIPLEASWEPILRERLEGSDLERLRCIKLPGWFGALGTSLLAAIASIGEPHDLLLFGNPGRGMVLSMHLLAAVGVAKRTVVYAHRRPKGDFLQKAEGLRFDTFCVSEHVASAWRAGMNGRVEVMYGVTRADRFTPAENTPSAPSPAGARPIRFVLLARLPNVSKGEGMAVEAYRVLPRQLRERCELHLASFIRKPDDREAGIVRHAWIAPEAVPDFLRSMDVMLTLSSNETFSQSIVQGMLTGLPVIATPLDVFTEKIGTELGLGECGLIARNADEVAGAMAKLADDPQLRAELGRRGREIALERYVWNTSSFLDAIARTGNAAQDSENAAV